MQAPAKAEDAFAKALPSSSAPNCWEEGSLHLPVGKAIGSPAGESRERRGKVAPSCKGKDDRCSEEASLLRHLEKMASEEEEVPLVVYLKENAALLTANGLHLSQNREAQQSPPTPPPGSANEPLGAGVRA